MGLDRSTAEMALAGLLHDTGKLYQRARVSLSESSRQMESMACPSYKGRSSHRHVLYTDHFFQEAGSHWPAWVDAGRVGRLATFHHRPSSPEEVILQQADWLSSGQDRRDRQAETSPGYLRQPLSSLFPRITLGQKAHEQAFYHGVCELRPDESLLPTDATPGDSLVDGYDRIAQRHLAAWREMPVTAAPSLFVQQVSWLTRCCCWCIPSTTMDEPDIPLYDHAVTTAAFASSLWEYHRQEESLNEDAIRDRSPAKFRLIGGDLSGIQSFIFDLPTEGAAGAGRVLRARSFYLGLLSEGVVLSLLDEIGLPPVNCIMDAGGRFWILAPNTPKAAEAVKRVRGDVQRWLVDRFHTRIAVVIDGDTEVTPAEFAGDAFPELFERANSRMAAAKHRRFADAFQDAERWNPDRMIHEFEPDVAAPGEQPALPLSYQFAAELGRILPRTTNLAFRTREPAGTASALRLKSEFADRFLRFFGRWDVTFHDRDPGASEGIQSTWAINPDPPLSVPSGKFIANYVALQDERDRERYEQKLGDLLVAQLRSDRDKDEPRPYEPNRPKTFAHLAVDDVRIHNGRTLGKPMLGVLKADVDRLGQIFTMGLGETLSVSRYATLSRMLDLFFRGWLTHQFRRGRDEDRYRNVYTIFAGGDDLLLVGPWWTMIRLAADVNRWFQTYVTGNGEVTFSASVICGHPRFPISRAAADAEHWLERAKDDGRNRVALFGTVLSWGSLNDAIDHATWLDDCVNFRDGHLPLNLGFVYRLLKYTKMHRRMREDRAHMHDPLWRSQLRYDLVRNIKPKMKKDDRQHADDYRRLEWLTAWRDDPGPIDALRVATTCTLYLNRGGR